MMQQSPPPPPDRSGVAGRAPIRGRLLGVAAAFALLAGVVAVVSLGGVSSVGAARSLTAGVDAGSTIVPSPWKVADNSATQNRANSWPVEPVARQVSIRGACDSGTWVPWVRSLHGEWFGGTSSCAGRNYAGGQFTYWVAGNRAILSAGAFVNANSDTPPTGYAAASPRLGGSHEFDWGPFHVTGSGQVGREFRVAFVTAPVIPPSGNVDDYLAIVRDEARRSGLPRADEWGVWMCSPGRSVAANIGNWGGDRTQINNFRDDEDVVVPLYWLNGDEITDNHGNPADIRDITIGAQMVVSAADVRGRHGGGSASHDVWTGCHSTGGGSKITDSTVRDFLDSGAMFTNQLTTDQSVLRATAPTQPNTSLLAVSPPLRVNDLSAQVAIAGSASGPAAGLAGKGVLSVAGGGRAVYELKLASVPSIDSPEDASVTAHASGGVRLLAGDVADTAANRRAAGSQATVAWNRGNWTASRFVTVFASGNAGYRDKPFSISHRFSDGFTDKWVLMTTPSGPSGSNNKTRVRPLGFLDARFGIDGVVPGLPEPTEPVAVVLDPVAPSFSSMAPGASESFAVRLSRAPDGWSETVYVSPVDDLSQTQARCKVAHPDWACRTKGQLIFNSSGDAVYEWSFSESPLTLRVGNAACGTSNRVLQEQLFAARRCSKPKSRPYVALTFTQANWDTAKQVTLTRTGNSFRSYTDRTGSLYVSFVHPWQLRTNSRTDSRTKTIGVSLNTSRVLNSPSQEIIFHGVEESDGQPKQMSDSEYQDLQQQQEQQEQQSDTSALEADIQERVDRTARTGDSWSNRIWRGALAAVQGVDPDADAREVDAAFAKRLADGHRSGGRTELADLWQTITDTLNNPPPPPTPVPTPTPTPTPVPTPTPTPTPVPTPTPTPTPVPTPTPTPTPTPPPPPPPVEAWSLDCDSADVKASEVTVAEPRWQFAFATFTVELCADNWGNTMIDYRIDHIDTDDADFGYTPQGTLVFAPFQNTAEVTVMINADSIPEGDETFALVLENVYSWHHIDLGTGRVKGTIIDNN